MSIALEVLEIAKRHVPRDQLPAILEVGVEVGDQSGVEPDSLEFWLESMLTSPPFRRGRPVIERVAGDVLRVSYLEVDDGRPDD